MTLSTFLYILIAPFRYLISGIAGAISVILILLMWCLVGEEFDTVKGLLGFIMKIPEFLVNYVNNPVIHYHQSLKPISWTFKKAVTVYRDTLRYYEDKIAGNHEWESIAKGHIKTCEPMRDQRMFRFWSYALVKGKVKRHNDAIKWNKECDEFEKNPRPNVTMTRSEVEPLDA